MSHLNGRRRAATVAAVGAALLIAGCGGDSDDGGNSGDGAVATNDIVFWTPQTTPERMAAQQEIAQAFEAETGIGVEVVAMAAADQNQALATGAASGDVPDVILHAQNQTAAWRSQGMLDTAAAAEVVDNLGTDTFNMRALELVTLDGEVGAVPSDGWVHLVAYRADLFDAAGVDVPTNLQELADAATALKATGVTGMAMGTQAGTPSGTESTESIYQTNGCQLVTEGEVTIDSPECVEAAELYKVLRDSSVEGDFDVTSARASYLAGNAAMLLFSTHILDELAGLDEANPPTCAECADNPAFIAENTGFITVLDEANPAQYGTVLSYGIPEGAHTAEAQQYIEYVLNDGYVDTLASATEGRIPLRTGTADEPDTFVQEWGALGIGPNLESSVSEIYGSELVSAIEEGMGSVARWGSGADSALAGEVSTQSIISASLEQLYSGTPAAEVMSGVAQQVGQLQSEL